MEVTTEAGVQARVSPCGIYDGQSVSGTGFSPSSSVPQSISFHRGYPYSYIIWGWTVGLLVAAVQRYTLTPSTWTWATPTDRKSVLKLIFESRRCILRYPPVQSHNAEKHRRYLHRCEDLTSHTNSDVWQVTSPVVSYNFQ
jgi:hypothetical protein